MIHDSPPCRGALVEKPKHGSIPRHASCVQQHLTTKQECPGGYGLLGVEDFPAMMSGSPGIVQRECAATQVFPKQVFSDTVQNNCRELMSDSMFCWCKCSLVEAIRVDELHVRLEDTCSLELPQARRLVAFSCLSVHLHTKLEEVSTFEVCRRHLGVTCSRVAAKSDARLHVWTKKQANPVVGWKLECQTQSHPASVDSLLSRTEVASLLNCCSTANTCEHCCAQ